jgi:hypothetical protein
MRSKDESQDSSDTESLLTPKYVGEDYWMVPCKINTDSNEFVPQVRPETNDFLDKFQMRQVWTSEEDRTLMQSIDRHGSKAWTRVAIELNNLIHGGRQIRQGKQCRERWFNHLNPGLKKGQWTINEDVFILEQQRIIGNRWSEISKCLEGRNENSVKNRWKSMIKRAEKEMPDVHDVAEVLLLQKQAQLQQSQSMMMFPQLMHMAGTYPPVVDNVRQGLFDTTVSETARGSTEPNYTEMFEQTPSPSIFIRR